MCETGLCYDTAKVSAILYTLRSRGELERWQDGGWYLTERGELKVKQYLYFYENLPRLKKAVIEASQILSQLNIQNIQETNKEHTIDVSYTPFSRLTKTNKDKHSLTETKSRLTDISSLTNELDEEEKEILNILLEHYEKWGSTWLPVEELVDRGYDYQYLARILRRLASKKLVYWYQKQGRVGLGKLAKQVLGVVPNGRRSS